MPASDAGKGDHYRPVNKAAFDEGWDRVFGEEVPSPCVEICHLDFTKEVCRGCLRTLDEIGVWSISNNDERRRILANVEERKRHVEDANG